MLSKDSAEEARPTPSGRESTTPAGPSEPMLLVPARWVINRGSNHPDHACIECVPWGDMVVKGFQCFYHQALALHRTAEAVEAAPAPKAPVQDLECCCCGNSCRGRQWWNRDAGFGVCASCGDKASQKEGASTADQHYGKRGIYWAIDEAH